MRKSEIEHYHKRILHPFKKKITPLIVESYSEVERRNKLTFSLPTKKQSTKFFVGIFLRKMLIENIMNGRK